MSEERDVQEVLARYVRATDKGDGPSLAALFTSDGCVEVFRSEGDHPVPTGKIEGSAGIGETLGDMAGPGSYGGWSHRMTHDAIVSMHGDRATIDVRFLVYGRTGPGAPTSTDGSTCCPAGVGVVDSGLFHANLKRREGGWRIAALRITHDLGVEHV